MTKQDKSNRNRLAIAVSGRADPSSLVGSCFHGEGDKWRGTRGCVVAEPSPGIYLCEFFDWIVGTSDHQKLVLIEDMIEWTFYDDATWMSNSDDDVRRRWDRERGKIEEPGEFVSGSEFIHGKADT